MKQIAEIFLLLAAGVIVTPAVFAVAVAGMIASIPTLLRRLRGGLYSRLLIAPRVLLTMKFMIEWIATRLCASVLGRSVPQDKHPRGWQLPWRLRVAHRLALTLAATD